MAWLEPHTTGDCVVAVDAPLIVRNLSGQHQCEWLVSKCFSRHDAGAHSSNRGMDAFRDGGRAFRLASRLGLALDPRMDDERLGRRRIIEVYPHPALVALFDLPKCLKYKAKRGRTVSSRKAEFGRCIELLESLDGAVPKLDLAVTKRADLKAELRLALTDRALDRAEDELDAFVCAYIACYYWTHGTRRCRVIGDVDYGSRLWPFIRLSSRFGGDSSVREGNLDAAAAEVDHRDQRVGGVEAVGAVGEQPDLAV